MAKPSKSNLRFIKDPVLDPYYIQLDDYCYIAQKSTYSEGGNEYQSTRCLFMYKICFALDDGPKLGQDYQHHFAGGLGG